MNPGSSWRDVPPRRYIETKLQLPFGRSSKVGVFLNFLPQLPLQWNKSSHHDQGGGSAGEGSGVPRGKTQYPTLLREGPLMSSSTVWELCCFPDLVTLHPYADSESTQVFHNQHKLWDVIIVKNAEFLPE